MISVKSGARRGRRAPGWGFVAPYVVVLILFGLAPAIYSVVEAFVVTSPFGSPSFSLVKNFVDVISDYRLPAAAANVAIYLLTWLPLLLLVIFVLALAMDAKRTRFARFTQFVTYVPGAITGSAAALLWIFMFSPTVSPIGPLLSLFTGKSGSFITDSTLTVVLAVMGISIGAGGWIVLVYGALTAIPGEILDAAKVDGANAWHTVWHIKLPMIRSYIAFILIVSTAGGFQVFVEPTVIGNAAPGQISHTWSLNELVYSYATTESNDGRASALSVLLLIVCVGLAFIVIKKTNFYSVGDR